MLKIQSLPCLNVQEDIRVNNPFCPALTKLAQDVYVNLCMCCAFVCGLCICDCYQVSKPEIEFHMIDIIYAALPICAQTGKATFSCKDDYGKSLHVY